MLAVTREEAQDPAIGVQRLAPGIDGARRMTWNSPRVRLDPCKAWKGSPEQETLGAPVVRVHLRGHRPLCWDE